jgi:hypothetical protein
MSQAGNKKNMSKSDNVSRMTRLVIGVPRSGTTLLTNLLAQHTHVTCLSEPFLPLAIPGNFRLRRFCRKLANQAGAPYLPPPMDRDPSNFLDYLHRLMDLNDNTLVIKETYRSDYGLQNGPLFDLFAQEKYPVVGIRRHPLSVVASSLRFYGRFKGIRRQLMRLAIPNLPDYGTDSEMAAYMAENWLSYEYWCKEHAIPMISYEELINDPESTLDNARDLLHIPVHTMDNGSNRKRLSGIGDSMGMRSLKPVPMGDPGKALSALPETIVQIVRDKTRTVAGTYGYEFP